MAKKTHIGLLFTYAFSFYRDVLRGIRQFSETRPDWTFIPLFVERGRLRSQGNTSPDGVLATLNNPTFAEAVNAWRRPLVNVSAAIRQLPYPRVAVDNRLVAQLAAQHFLERGLKNFAFIGYAQLLASEERDQAFCDLIQKAGYEVARYHTSPDCPFDPYGSQWYLDGDVGDWLSALPKPVGIFVSGDILGAAVSQICRELELRIPDEIALVGVDNDDLYCHLAQPPLSSVIVNAQQIGYEAAALLNRLMTGQKPPKAPILVSPSGIHVRSSSEVLAIDDEDVIAADRFIREHAHTPITVADVLKAVPVSRRSLERRFQRVFHHGLAEEICRVRLQRSKNLLVDTDLNMVAVAKHAGFSSTRHLTDVFRRIVGQSPSQYRRTMRMRHGSR